MIAPAPDVVDALRRLIVGFDSIDSGFVYGSVARGTATPASDVDLFLITIREPRPDTRTVVRDAVDALQRELGYRPDPVHVVEMFATTTCADALAGPLVLRATHMAACGTPIDRITLESDDLEILRALADRRITVRPSPVLDSLTAMARNQIDTAAGRVDVPPGRVLQGIGLPLDDHIRVSPTGRQP